MSSSISRTKHSKGIPTMPKQLNSEQRAILEQLLQLKRPRQEIAERLKVDRVTVYREVKRNSGPKGYLAHEAQQRAETRRWAWRTRKLDDAAVRKYVTERLKRQW